MKGWAAAVIVSIAAVAAAAGPLAGHSLEDALRELQARGLALVYTSEVVRPAMRVATEPVAKEPEAVLAEILRPHGLTTRPAPGGRLVVVRLAAAPTAAPPAPVLSFGSEVRMVRLDVSVADRDGRFVGGLAGSDFEVTEDGVAQPIVSFARHEVPLSLVLLLDASNSMAPRMKLSRAAAIGFLDQLGPADEASVVQFNDATVVQQAPTRDRELLRGAVSRVEAQGSTALYNALYAVLRSVPADPADSAARRRVLVLLSDGEDTASLVWEEQVVELARRREATVHVIDLASGEAANRSSRLLRLLAEESGGEVHRPASADGLSAVYARIADELRNRYTIGYTSAAAPGDARWRRISVRVRGRRDVGVRHRTGYYGGGAG